MANCLQSPQKLHDLGLSPVDRSDELATYHSVPVDDIGLGNLDCTVKILALLRGIADGEQIHPVLFEKFVVRALILIHADSQHRDALVFHALLKNYQGRHFLHARGAPRRPEVQNDYLATQLAQRDFAVCILHCEIRGVGPDVARPRAAIAAGQQKSKASD